MRSLLRPTLIVTGLTLGAQVFALVAQALIAKYLGASSEADALFAAMTLPQYVTTIFASALAVVFIPAFMHRRAEGGEEDAWRFATGVVNASVILLGLIAGLGMLFAKPLLALAVPGLSEDALALAAQLSLFLWPSVVASAVVALLTNLHQIEERFTWSSFVPVLGALANVALLAALVPYHGATGVAAAATLNVVVQCALLARILARGRYSPTRHLTHPGVLEIGRLILPLIVSGLFVRSTTVIDRFLASGLPSGSISHLGYASRLITALGAAVSAGLGAVLFPPLADAIARGDIRGFRETASRSLRSIWLIVAPIMTVGIALALPGVTVLFERGAFGGADSAAVGILLQVYLLALIPISLSTVTSRAIYALKNTRLIAIVGAVEAVAYIAYTFVLARTWGILGIAAGFVIYYTISIAWQGLYLRAATGKAGGGRVLRSLAATTVMATLAGLAAWLASLAEDAPLARLALGGTAGAAVYLLALAVVKPEEASGIWGKLGLRRTKLAP